MTCPVASLLALALCLPQGPPDAAPPTSFLQLPDRPETMAHVAFTDAAGLPVARAVRTFGTFDLDGNRIADAFWLGDPAAAGQRLSIGMGREHSPGRFRNWPVAHGLTGAFTGAAALRQAWLEQDTLLLVEPQAPYPTRLSFDLAFVGNPHANGSFATTPFYCLPPLLGAREIATHNCEGDGCDDVVVLYDLGTFGCSVVKYRLDAPYGVPILLGTARVDLPLAVQRVRLLDFDGDGRSDVAAEVPGYGVVVGRDDGGPFLQFAAFVPVGPIAELVVGTFGPSDALAMVTSSGVLATWQEPQGLGWHWLPSPVASTTAAAALLPNGAMDVDLVSLASDGRTLSIQGLTRGASPQPVVTSVPTDPVAYAGSFVPCAMFASDLEGDGDQDLVLQHPDGAQWYTVRNERIAMRPELLSLTQDLSLVTLGWYGATFTVGVPPAWDFGAFPSIELQVMVEHPYTSQQLRWDRRIEPLDPLLRTARFTLEWQDSAQTTAAFLANPFLVPAAFAQAGYLSAGRRTQLNFLGIGPGNLNFQGAERRTEPMLWLTDPGGSGNKSAQGVVWEKRTAPPLPKADAPLLPWQ